MFLNYQDIANNYVPNNIINEFDTPRSYTKLNPMEKSKPYELYNAKNELEGYFWNQGDSLNLEFNIDGEITVESDAIILYAFGQTPFSTKGKIGQRAYNIADLRSWTCVGVSTSCVWVQDSEFTYPENGLKSIYLSAEDYLKNKNIVVRLYNFRFEQIHEKTFSGEPKIIFTITKELSETLKKGIYYCSLTCVSDETCQTIFGPEDCKLLVK